MFDAEWYYVENGKSVGPISKVELAQRLRTLGEETLIYGPGLSAWTGAKHIPGFRAHDFQELGAPPPPRAAAGRRADEIDYEITGDDMQFIEIELDPGETVIAEAGAMMYMSPGIEMETKFGDPNQQGQGFLGKIMSAGKRVLTGESLFMTTFIARGQGKQRVAFAAPYPGKILPMDLAQLGGDLLCQKESFLCSARGIQIGIAFTKRFGAGLFGGEGFILQRLQGDGMAFVHAGGTVCHKRLGPGETLRVDTGCLVAFQPSVQYEVKFVGGFKNTLFGGEGLFFTVMTGPGEVWLQSIPFSRLAGRIAAAAGGGKGEGSILGGLGNLLDGDNS